MTGGARNSDISDVMIRVQGLGAILTTCISLFSPLFGENS